MEQGKAVWIYGFVIVVLAGYFGWLMDRMAAFSTNGFPRLEKLGVGFAIALLGLALGLGLTLLAKRRRSRDGRR